MRDLLLTLLVLGSVPFTFLQPYIGLLVWSWLGYMNPHRLAYGFAYSFPFVFLISVVTILSTFFSKEKFKIPINGVTIVWFAFMVWMSISSVLAFNDAMYEFTRMIKIQMMIFITLLLFQDKNKIKLLVWVIVGSLGFYGVKGGVFTILTGGSYRVWGPPGSFIEGNNELALALIMVLPLMFFLFKEAKNKYLKLFLLFCMLSMSAAILGSYSRGALLAFVMMSFFLWLKSNKKVVSMAIAVFILASAATLLPQKWFDRMNTIENYEEDGSALGRINAWYFAFNLAKDNPFFGGGYGAFSSRLFLDYAPDPDDFHDAHSIYFEVLGEQGFVGLFLFVLLWVLSWRLGTRVLKYAKGKEEWMWAYWLASMCQVSLIGYATGGAFLGLAYFDLPYHIMAILVVVHVVVMKEKEKEEGEKKRR